MVIVEFCQGDRMRYIVRNLSAEGQENQQLSIGNVAFEVNWRSVEREGQPPERLIRLVVELRPKSTPSNLAEMVDYGDKSIEQKVVQ